MVVVTTFLNEEGRRRRLQDSPYREDTKQTSFDDKKRAP